MVDEKTATKADPAGPKGNAAAAATAAAAKPKPKRAAAPGGDFGDAELCPDGLAPLGLDKRKRTPAQHALDLVGLVLSPANLAIGVTLLPMLATAKYAFVGIVLGVALGAVFIMAFTVPLVRFGLSPGVLVRVSLGVRGAKLWSFLRAITAATFFAHACMLAVQTLVWCVLCSFPKAAALLQRVPLLGSQSLVAVVLTIIAALAVWAFARELGTRARVFALVPGLVLIAALFALPGNLPADAAWSMLDLSGRGQTDNPIPVMVIATFWATSLMLMTSSESKHLPSQLGQVIGPASVTLPWLIGAVGFALAVLSSGRSEVGLFDLPALACRRLPVPWLALVLLCAAVAFIWPLVWAAKKTVQASSQELAMSGKARRGVEYGSVAVGLIVAVGTRAQLVPHAYTVLFAAAALVGIVALMTIAQYYLVERGRLVLDELYLWRGPYRGVFGVSPAGVLSLVGGAAAFAWALQSGRPMTTALTLAALGSALLQVIIGNVQRVLIK